LYHRCRVCVPQFLRCRDDCIRFDPGRVARFQSSDPIRENCGRRGHEFKQGGCGWAAQWLVEGALELPTRNEVHVFNSPRLLTLGPPMFETLLILVT